MQPSWRIPATCLSHAKQWGLRPDIQLSTTILVFRSWQQDPRLENGQGTDAKLCWHIFATLWWIFTPLVKRLYNSSGVSGTMNLLQPILVMGDRNLKPCLQRFRTVLTWDSELPIPEAGGNRKQNVFELSSSILSSNVFLRQNLIPCRLSWISLVRAYGALAGPLALDSECYGIFNNCINAKVSFHRCVDLNRSTFHRHVEWATCSTMTFSAGLRAFSIMGQHGSLCEPKMKSKSFHTQKFHLLHFCMPARVQ